MPLTIDQARLIALSFPDSEEHDHWGRPSFRVKTKIFMTLWPDEMRAVLKLTSAQQAELVREEPQIYEPVPGAWGQKGYTSVYLSQLNEAEFRTVLTLAWRNVAPKKTIQAFDQK